MGFVVVAYIIHQARATIGFEFFTSYRYLVSLGLGIVVAFGWVCILFAGDTEGSISGLSHEHLLKLRHLGFLLIIVPFVLVLLMWLKVI